MGTLGDFPTDSTNYGKRKVKMEKYELLFTHTINLLEIGCEVNFKYPFCSKR